MNRWLIPVAFLVALVWMLASCDAQAQPAQLIEYRRLGSAAGHDVGYFDHGPNRCYLVGVGSISCVVRAKP